MFIMRKVIVLSYLLRVCLCFEIVHDDFDDASSTFAKVKEEQSYPNDNEVLNATMFRMVKKYYCRSDIEEDKENILTERYDIMSYIMYIHITEGELLVYGTRSWTFPCQDVTLTLRYPMENAGVEAVREYILTGLRVVFHLSGSESRGYITDGGMHQDHIRVVFSFRNITSLSYQFYLHGVPKSLYNFTENFAAHINLC